MALSVVEQLDEIFDSLPSPTTSPLNPNFSTPSLTTTTRSTPNRTAPLYLLPSIITAFESKRGTPLFSQEERNLLEEFTKGKNESVDREDFVSILLAMGVTGTPNKNGTDINTPILIENESNREELQVEGKMMEMESPDLSSVLSDGSPMRKVRNRPDLSDLVIQPSEGIVEEGDGPGEAADKQKTVKSSTFKSSLPVPTLKDDSMSRSYSQPIPESKSYFDQSSSTPTISHQSRSVSVDFGTSTPSTSTGIPRPSVQGASSSLSFRQRTSPLETSFTPDSNSKLSALSHSRPPLSSSSITRSRPIPPAKLRRTSDGYTMSRSNSSNLNTSEAASSPTTSSNGGESSPALGRMDQFASSGRRISGPIGNGSFSRSDSMTSDLSISSSSGGQSTGSRPSSPHSPPSSLDFTSYHARPVSPMEDVGSLDDPPAFDSLLQPPQTYFSSSTSPSPEKPDTSDHPGYLSSYMRRDRSNGSNETDLGGGGGTNSRGGSMYLGEGMGMADSIFGRPMSGIALSGDAQFQQLVVQAQELSKRLREAEGRLQSSASSYEQEHIDLETRLEEARAELSIKRREEKELRGNEKQHLAQISSLESDIAKLDKNMEKSREQYETMKRSYTDQCSEAEKLRELVSEVRRDNRVAEEAAQTYGVHVQEFERDRETLQSAIGKLEDELAIALSAQESLDDQKAENLLLNETIDRLRFDMEELRLSNRKSLIFDESSGTSTSSKRVDSSAEGNLGMELARRLAQTELEADEQVLSEDENDISEQEEIITTHRRIKKRSTRSSNHPAITVVEDRVVSDATIQTDPIETNETDVQTDPIASDLMAPEEKIVEVKSEQELQKELAKSLGIDWNRLNHHLQQDKIPLAGKSVLVDAISSGLSSRRAGRWTSRISARIPSPPTAPAFFVNVFPNAAKPYIVQIFDTTTSFILYSLVMYMSGVITGSMLIPTSHHHTLAPFHVLIGASDQAAWHQYNNLGSVWGEGLGNSGGNGIGSTIGYWLNEVVWGGVSVIRRVPV